MSDAALIVADASQPITLDNLTSKCTVLINTAGPYTTYGSSVVGACVRNGCHYCDLTGELGFVREMVLRYHEAAKQSGVKIVHSCGFECVPFDLTTWMVAKALREKGCQIHKSEVVLTDLLGGFSGGTLATARLFFEDVGSDRFDEMKDIYYLFPPD